MASVTLRATGPASATDVWEAYADPSRWSEWSPHIRRVEAIGRLRPGLAGRVWSFMPPPVSFDVTSVDAKARKWSWRAGLGPVWLSFDHGVTARRSGSATWLTMHGPLPLLLLYAPVAQVALFRLVRTR